MIYKGSHQPLISKELFDEVQQNLIVPSKQWHKKQFPFKTVCICGSCGGGVTAEEKYKKIKGGGFIKYVYYHCARSVDYECNEPYVTEGDLIQQLLSHLDEIKINQVLLTKHIKNDIERFHKLRSQVLHQEYLSGNLTEIELLAVQPNDEEMAKQYLKHILETGSAEDRQQVMGMIRTRFVLRSKKLVLN